MSERIVAATKGKRLIGVRFEKDMEAFVLELCGGGYSVGSTMTAMLILPELAPERKGASSGKIKFELLNGEVLG